jgi:CRP-like cAMP-binding protein
MLTVVEKVDLLQHAEIFREGRTDSLARIASAAQEVGFQPLQMLFNENEAAEAMFILLEGEVMLTCSGQERDKLSEFQAAGALAVLAEQAYAETAIAIRPTQALRIGQQDFYDAVAEDINIARGILRALVHMVSKSR